MENRIIDHDRNKSELMKGYRKCFIRGRNLLRGLKKVLKKCVYAYCMFISKD